MHVYVDDQEVSPLEGFLIRKGNFLLYYNLLLYFLYLFIVIVLCILHLNFRKIS